MRLSREAKIGIFATVSLAALYFGYNFLRGKRLFSNLNEYHVVYNQIDGIVKSTPIYFKGLKVGQVERLSLHRTDSANQIIATLLIDESIQLARTSQAQIVSMDLLGSKAISLIVPDILEPISEGDTLIGSQETSLTASISEIVAPVKAKTENVLVSLNRVLGEIDKMLEGGGSQNLSSGIQDLALILRNLKSTTAQLDQVIANEKGKIGRITGNVEVLSDALRKNSDALSSSMKNFKTVSDSLAAAPLKSTIEQLEKTTEQLALITAKIDKGEGTAGKLINDAQLYDNLNKSSSELNLLLKDLREHPSRYVSISVFGGKKEKKK